MLACIIFLVTSGFQSTFAYSIIIKMVFKKNFRLNFLFTTISQISKNSRVQTFIVKTKFKDIKHTINEFRETRKKSMIKPFFVKVINGVVSRVDNEFTHALSHHEKPEFHSRKFEQRN